MIYSFSISIFLCIKINKLKVLNNINIKKTKNKPIFLLFPIIIVTSKNKLKKKCPEWDSNPRSPPCKGGILTN